jgi:mono/diheme cytochrome c family protein
MRLFATTVLLAAVPVSAIAVAADASVYLAKCSMCHQVGAVGIPGLFPRLAGRVNLIAKNPKGRRYLALVLMNGLVGTIQIDGTSISGAMPPFSGSTDNDIASVVNYLAGLQPVKGKPAPFTAAELAKVRAEERISGNQVLVERQRLVEAGAIP